MDVFPFSYLDRRRRSGTPYLGKLSSSYDWGVFQVLKSYYLKIISTILHPSEWAPVLVSYIEFVGPARTHQMLVYPFNSTYNPYRR